MLVSYPGHILYSHVMNLNASTRRRHHTTVAKAFDRRAAGKIPVHRGNRRIRQFSWNCASQISANRIERSNTAAPRRRQTSSATTCSPAVGFSVSGQARLRAHNPYDSPIRLLGKETRMFSNFRGRCLRRVNRVSGTARSIAAKAEFGRSTRSDRCASTICLLPRSKGEDVSVSFAKSSTFYGWVVCNLRENSPTTFLPGHPLV